MSWAKPSPGAPPPPAQSVTLWDRHRSPAQLSWSLAWAFPQWSPEPQHLNSWACQQCQTSRMGAEGILPECVWHRLVPSFPVKLRTAGLTLKDWALGPF